MKSNPLYHVLAAKEISDHWQITHDIFIRVHLKRFNESKWKKSGRTRIFSLAEVYNVLGNPKIPLDPKFTAVDDPRLLSKVYTASEAADKWLLAPGHIRKDLSITNNPDISKQMFLKGEYRKAGSDWLLTKDALNRLYGTPSERKEMKAAKNAPKE